MNDKTPAQAFIDGISFIPEPELADGLTA